MTKPKIVKLIQGSFIPVKEEFFRMFTRNYILQNSSISVWISGENSAQEHFVKSVWEVIGEYLKFKSEYGIITDEILYEQFMKPYNEDVLLVPIGSLYHQKFRLVMPFFKTWYEIYMRKTGHVENSKFYVNIFPVTTWLSELLLVVVLPAVFWLACYVCKTFALKKHQLCISDCCLHVLSLISNQGPSSATCTFSMRFLTFTVMLFGFVVSVFYSALLVANQATSFAAPPFSNLEELRLAGTHQLCIANRSWALRQFMRSKYADYSKNELLPRWAHLINGPGCPDDYDDFLPAICNHTIVSLVLFKHFTSANGVGFGDCVVVPFKRRYFEDYALITIGRNFPHTGKINKSLNKMGQSGLLQYIWFACRKYVPPVEAKSAMVPNVSFGHVKGAFIAYVTCVCFSSFLLCLEILIDRLLKNKTHKSMKSTNKQPRSVNSNGPNCIPFYH